METAAQAPSAEVQSTQETLTTVSGKISFQDIVVEDLSNKLDEVEEAFYVINEMKKAAELAEAKEEHSESAASGHAMPVHSREPRASTCTSDPETAFTYADLHGRPDTPQTRSSREDQGERAARPARRRRLLGGVVIAAAMTATTRTARRDARREN